MSFPGVCGCLWSDPWAVAAADYCAALGQVPGLVGLVLPAGVQHFFGECGGCKSLWDPSTVCSWAVLDMELSSVPTEQTPELWAGVQRSVPVLS